MRVLALTKYGRLGASSRLRTFQYVPYLGEQGIVVDAHPLLDDWYVRELYSRKVSRLRILRAYFLRVSRLLSARSYDAIWMEKELLPWLPFALEVQVFRLGLPVLVDYDDAVFHRYDEHKLSMVRRVLGDKIDRIMSRAAIVTCGNKYLEDRALRAGARRVERVPTVVDLGRYSVTPRGSDDILTVGWIGSPSTAPFLSLVSPTLSELKRRYKIRCVAIGAREDQLLEGPFESVPWSETREVAELQKLDIGIMPLPDAPFERGKCGYKLIQYMACGIPVVASPVGANCDIVDDGKTGFLASDAGQWTRALVVLLEDEKIRRRFSKAGRAAVEAQFTLQVQGPRLARLLRGLREEVGA